MRHEFTNDTRVAIDKVRPSVIRSSIEVNGVGGQIRDVDVAVDVSHSFTSDLVIFLQGPDGRRVLLMAGEGGRGRNLKGTILDDEADSSIEEASAPFRGRFRPEGSLSAFNESDANGRWSLYVVDPVLFDGGSLNRWSLVLETDEPDSDTVDSNFEIQVRFLGGLTSGQQSAFREASARWSQIIVGDLPAVRVGNQIIDDLLIEAQGVFIDGTSGILGQAGPTRFRPGSLLPATGIMEFDTADLARMESDGSLVNVIIHEMGHVLGIGTLWSAKDLIFGADSANPIFTGQRAMQEFAELMGASESVPVPVANTGGPGTRGGHWREAVFGTELMTGFLNLGVNPMSRVTIASLADLGYEVNIAAADDYRLPSALELALMGIGGDIGCQRCTMCCRRARSAPPIVLPESALV